jgi:hypothetical protein
MARLPIIRTIGKKTMKVILFAVSASILGLYVAGAAVSATEPTKTAPATTAAEAADLPESSVEIFRIAPGQHEAFLKLLADTEAAKVQVGMQPDQLYIHQDGASWDFVLIKAKGQDPAKWKQVADILHAKGHPSGPDYFFMIRKMIAEHTDTSAIGPTTATAYLATRKTK